MGGQGDPQQLMPAERRLLKGAAIGLLAAFGLLAGGVFTRAEAAARPEERQTPSGMPVPRYVSLKFDKVNARAGPGDDHKLLFVYRVRGLPLQVLDVRTQDLPAAYRHKLVLSRPDQHVAWRGDRLPDDPLALVDLIRGAAPPRDRP